MQLTPKIVRCLIKDYTSGIIPYYIDSSVYEDFIDEYEIELDFFTFESIYTEIKKERELDLEISKEMQEKQRLSENQIKLKKDLNFWVTMLPRDFSTYELISVLITTLISYKSGLKNKN